MDEWELNSLVVMGKQSWIKTWVPSRLILESRACRVNLAATEKSRYNVLSYKYLCKKDNFGCEV